MSIKPNAAVFRQSLSINMEEQHKSQPSGFPMNEDNMAKTQTKFFKVGNLQTPDYYHDKFTDY